MMPIVRYDRPPTLAFRFPVCDGCDADVEHDGDGWVCPDCGTYWDTDSSEDTPGTSYAEWSGEDVSGLPLIVMGGTAWIRVHEVRNEQVRGDRS